MLTCLLDFSEDQSPKLPEPFSGQRTHKAIADFFSLPPLLAFIFLILRPSNVLPCFVAAAGFGHIYVCFMPVNVTSHSVSSRAILTDDTTPFFLFLSVTCGSDILTLPRKGNKHGIHGGDLLGFAAWPVGHGSRRFCKRTGLLPRNMGLRR